MNIQKFLKSKQWIKMGRWKHVGVSECLVIFSMTDQELQSAYPITPSAYLVFGHNQFIPKKDFDQNVAYVKDLLNKKPTKTAKQIKDVILKSVQELNNFKLEADYQSFYKYFSIVRRHGRYWYEMMLLDAALQKLYPKSLAKSFKLGAGAHSAQSLLAKAALPKRLFPMIEEKYHLLEIAIDIKQGRDITRKLKLHVKKYSWLNSLCWWNEPFTFDYFKKQAQKLAKSNPRQELRRLKNEREKQYQDAEVLLHELKKLYPKAWQYLDLIRDLADLKEDNWDVVSVAGVRFRPIFKKLAAKYYLSYNQLMMHTPEEMLKVVAKGKTAKTEVLNQRMKNFGMISKRTSIYSLTKSLQTFQGKEVIDYLRLLDGEVKVEGTISGMPIWAGKAKGGVRILNLVDDVPKMKHGEILVCPMTDPDYLPAIYKASAVVTDQGGLLCHAAIVARELQTPCIVGTEIATKVLKDGDLVEVDANTGIVKIVKRA